MKVSEDIRKVKRPVNDIPEDDDKNWVQVNVKTKEYEVPWLVPVKKWLGCDYACKLSPVFYYFFN